MEMKFINFVDVSDNFLDIINNRRLTFWFIY
jgi:hypothetical protein